MWHARSFNLSLVSVTIVMEASLRIRNLHNLSQTDLIFLNFGANLQLYETFSISVRAVKVNCTIIVCEHVRYDFQ